MTCGNKINLMVLIVSMPVGGVENQVLSVIRRLNKQKYDISICCIKGLGTLGKKAGDMGFKTIELNLMKSSRFSLAIPFRISKVLKENKIHILWSHQYVANLYGRIAALLANTPLTIPTFHVLYDNPKLHRRIFNHILSYRTDMMIGVSNAVVSDMIRYDKVRSRKTKVIYNGIDVNKFDFHCSRQDARKSFDLPPDSTIIGTVGRTTEQKGHRYLIEAAAGIEDICVVIAGDGPLLEELKNLVERLNIRCIFLGELKNEQIPVFLQAIDIFCFPSLWEGMPLALIEAMSAGIAIVASDIPPHREVLDDAGVLIEPANSEAIINGLKMLIDNSSLRETYIKRAKERSNKFSIDGSKKAFEDLLDSMLARKGLLQ